jgi:hypothetical protein
MEQNSDYPGKQWQPIFDHMVDNFNVSLTLSEMQDLIDGVSKVIGHAALQAKCDRYEAALKDISAQTKYSPGSSWEDIAQMMKQKALDVIANEAISAREGEKAMKSEHNVSIGGWITYCQECGFPIDPIDECNCENLP